MTNKEFINLLTRLQHNDMGALSRIYEEYFHNIYSVAFSECRNSSDAYDIASNVILKLCNYPSNPNEIENHIGLLTTITRNEAKNFLKKRNRSIVGTELMENIAYPSVQDALWLSDILDVLSEEEKEIFFAHVIWGINLKEYALEKAIPYINIKRKYKQIKQKIKEIYDTERKAR